MAKTIPLTKQVIDYYERSGRCRAETVNQFVARGYSRSTLYAIILKYNKSREINYDGRRRPTKILDKPAEVVDTSEESSEDINKSAAPRCDNEIFARDASTSTKPSPAQGCKEIGVLRIAWMGGSSSNQQLNNCERSKQSQTREWHLHRKDQPQSENSEEAQLAQHRRADKKPALCISEISGWNISRVVSFIGQHEEIKEYAERFAEHEIDGKALILLMNQESTLKGLTSMFKYGPAMKIGATLERYHLKDI